MAKLTYSEQLRHPKWQRKRLEVLQAAGWECENCGDKETTLNVHHKRYIKGRMAWEYGRDELVALCEPCHQSDHQDRDCLDRLLAEAGIGSHSQAIGLFGGYLYLAGDIDPGTAEESKQTDRGYFVLGVAAACLELQPEAWGRLIRDHVARHPQSPARHLVDEWEEKAGGKA